MKRINELIVLLLILGGVGVVFSPPFLSLADTSSTSATVSEVTTPPPPPPSPPPGGGPIIIPVKISNESITINSGAEYTRSLKVTLTLTAQNATHVKISNNSNLVGASWLPLQTKRDWTLTKGDGKKTVYAKFGNLAAGVFSKKVVSDSIILDTVPPTNVSNFQAKAGDSQIILTWKNPSDKDFEGVRIIRSDKFFPTDPEKGNIIYEGSGEFYKDVHLINKTTYYYTVFSYDKAGNFSSGAISFATPQAPPPPPPKPPVLPIPPPAPQIPLGIKKLSLSDFDFFQENKKIEFSNGIIKVKGGKSLTISLDYKKTPEVLKTILVALHKKDKSFSFILRVNREKTEYSATVLMPQEPGIYPFTILILDYKNQYLKKIAGKFIVEAIPEIGKVPLKRPFWQTSKFIFLLILLIVLALLILVLEKRKRKKREEVDTEKT